MRGRFEDRRYPRVLAPFVDFVTYHNLTAVAPGNIDHAGYRFRGELGEVGRGHLPPLNLRLHRLLGRQKVGQAFRLVRTRRRLQRGTRLGSRGHGGLFRSLAPILARVIPRVRHRVPHPRHILLDLVHDDFTVAGTQIFHSLWRILPIKITQKCNEINLQNKNVRY